MKIKLIDILNASKSLSAIGELPMSVKDSFYFMKFIKKCEEELYIYQENHDKLLKKYGYSEDGVKYQIPIEKSTDYLKELDELNNIEIKLDFQKFKFDINKLALLDIELKPNDLYRVQKFVDFIEIENKDNKENIEK